MAVAGFVSEKCFSSILIKAIAFVFSEHGWTASSQEKNKKKQRKENSGAESKALCINGCRNNDFWGHLIHFRKIQDKTTKRPSVVAISNSDNVLR